MSLETWKEEFYPVPADESADNALEAAEHSLRKWLGLRNSEMVLHGVTKAVGAYIQDSNNDCLDIDGDSCALCAFQEAVYDSRNECTGCPILLVQRNTCFDGKRSPYSVFITRADPEPMIALLEKTVAHLKESK